MKGDVTVILVFNNILIFAVVVWIDISSVKGITSINSGQKLLIFINNACFRRLPKCVHKMYLHLESKKVEFRKR